MVILQASLLPQELNDRRWMPVLLVGALSGALAGAAAAYVTLRPRPCESAKSDEPLPSRRQASNADIPKIRATSAAVGGSSSGRTPDGAPASRCKEQPRHRRPQDRKSIHTQAPPSQRRSFLDKDADAVAAAVLATPSRPRSGKRMRPDGPTLEALGAAGSAVVRRGGQDVEDNGAVASHQANLITEPDGGSGNGAGDLGGRVGGYDGGGKALGPLLSPLAATGRRDPRDPAPRSGSLSWDDYFMALAFLSAERSKDPNKQVGAVIVNVDNIILAIGYNGFPRGCCDSDLPWAKEALSSDGNPDPLATKYPYVVHAEANALLNKNAASVAGARVYVTMFPCNECAKLLIQAGVREVVYHEDKVLHLEGGSRRNGSEADGVGQAATAAAAVAAPPASAGQKQRERRLRMERQHDMQQQQGEALSGTAGTPSAVLTPCTPLYDDEDDDDDEGEEEEEEEADGKAAWSAAQQHHIRQLTPDSSARRASLASLATPASPAATAAAVAGSPPGNLPTRTPASAASRDALPAAAPANDAAAAAAAAVTPDGVNVAAAGDNGPPWSGFWSHPRDDAATRGSVSLPVSAATVAAAPSSAQILSSWARSQSPADSPRHQMQECNGAAAVAGSSDGIRGGNAGVDHNPAVAPLSASLASAAGADVCYLASLRLLRLAGVKLRQHRIQKVISIPGPAARNSGAEEAWAN